MNIRWGEGGRERGRERVRRIKEEQDSGRKKKRKE